MVRNRPVTGVFQFFACRCYCYGRYLVPRHDRRLNICWAIVQMLNDCSIAEHTSAVCMPRYEASAHDSPTRENLKCAPCNLQPATFYTCKW